MAVCRGCGQNLCTQAGVSMPEQTKPLMEKDKSLGGGGMLKGKAGPVGSCWPGLSPHAVTSSMDPRSLRLLNANPAFQVYLSLGRCIFKEGGRNIFYLAVY